MAGIEGPSCGELNAKAFPDEIENALSENAATDLEALRRMLPQTAEFRSTAGLRS